MKLSISRDLMAGLLFFGLGATCAIYSLVYYQIGSLQRIGPGMFPMIVGGLMAGLGVLISVKAVIEDGPRFELPLTKAFWVLASVALFALTIQPFGIVPALVLLGVVSSTASCQLGPWSVLLLTLAMAVFIPLIFVGILGLTIPLFAWPF